MPSTLSRQQPQAFWDKIAQKYATKRVADPAAYEAKLTRVRALLRAEDRVLEIGCGTGSTALTLARSAREREGGQCAVVQTTAAGAAVAQYLSG